MLIHDDESTTNASLMRHKSRVSLREQKTQAIFLLPFTLTEMDPLEDEDHKAVATDPTGMRVECIAEIVHVLVIGRYERFQKCLGMGAYKKVFLAFDQEEGVEVAWNELRLDHMQKKVHGEIPLC